MTSIPKLENKRGKEKKKNICTCVYTMKNHTLRIKYEIKKLE